MLARPTCVMGRIVCGCGLMGLIYAFHWPLVPKDCTEYQKKRKENKKERGGFHPIFCKPTIFGMSRGQGRVVSGGQIRCGDGMALSYDPCHRTNMTRCGPLQYLSLSGLYSNGFPLALGVETMGAVVGGQSEVQTGDVRPMLY